MLLLQDHELRAYHVILPDFLVNREKGGIQREHCPEENSEQFNIHETLLAMAREMVRGDEGKSRVDLHIPPPSIRLS